MSKLTKFLRDQPNIAIDVDYFDDSARDDLSKYVSAPQIADVVGNTLIIPSGEILTYFLFHQRRVNVPELANFKALSRRIESAVAMLDRFIEPNGTSLCVPSDVGSVGNYITENLGEAVGLAVVNRIHKLIHADWNRIPQSHGRKAISTFDYEYPYGASDGEYIIQIETKGTFVKDCKKHCRNTRAHRKSIELKKQKISDKGEFYKYPADIRYGTILGIDCAREKSMHCWLVDPEGDDMVPDAQKFRLLNRMKFIKNCITNLSQQSILATVLQNRIAVLENLQNPFELDGVPLFDSRGEPFSALQWDTGTGGLFSNRSWVTDGATRGVVFPSINGLIFRGVQQYVINLAIQQDFSKIITYEMNSGTVEKEVECVIPRKRFDKEFSIAIESGVPSAVEYAPPEGFAPGTSDKDKYVRFRLHGLLYYAPSGTVVGELPISGAN